jgi:hypothetical protein
MHVAEHVVHTNPDGSRTFIKRMSPAPDIRSHLNVEAEILAPLLVDAVELPALPVTPLFDAVSGTWLVVMPFVEQTDPVTANGSHACGEPSPIDHDTLARLALVDVLIGNADRQPRNVLHSADGRVIPIDHDVAFLAPDDRTRAIGLAGFVPGFGGVVAGPLDNGYRRWLLARCGTLEHLLGSSPLYAPFQRQMMSDRQVRMLHDAAAFVVDRISDPRIDAALAMVPDAVIVGDPTARKREIRNTLHARRHGLEAALRRYCDCGDRSTNRAGASWQDGTTSPPVGQAEVALRPDEGKQFR